MFFDRLPRPPPDLRPVQALHGLGRVPVHGVDAGHGVQDRVRVVQPEEVRQRLQVAVVCLLLGVAAASQDQNITEGTICV